MTKSKRIEKLLQELDQARQLRDHYYGRMVQLEKENAALKRRTITRLFTMVETHERRASDAGQDQQL